MECLYFIAQYFETCNTLMRKVIVFRNIGLHNIDNPFSLTFSYFLHCEIYSWSHPIRGNRSSLLPRLVLVNNLNLLEVFCLSDKNAPWSSGSDLHDIKRHRNRNAQTNSRFCYNRLPVAPRPQSARKPPRSRSMWCLILCRWLLWK